MLTYDEVRKFHQAAHMIELDGAEGYQSCVAKFGRDIAGTALVMWLRSFKDYPDEIEMRETVNNILEKVGVLSTIINLEVPASLNDLARLHDVLIDLGIKPSLDLIHRILLSDRDLLGSVYLYGASDTIVADQFCNYVKKNYHLFNLSLKE